MFTVMAIIGTSIIKEEVCTLIASLHILAQKLTMTMRSGGLEKWWIFQRVGLEQVSVLPWAGKFFFFFLKRNTLKPLSASCKICVKSYSWMNWCRTFRLNDSGLIGRKLGPLKKIFFFIPKIFIVSLGYLNFASYLCILDSKLSIQYSI